LTVGSAAARGRAAQPVLQTGDGGNGADGLLGGAGGDGGVIRLEAPQGVLTIHQRPGLLRVGNGGHGGRGVVGGQDLLTFTPPSALPMAGGDSGGIAATWSSVVGAELVDNPNAPPAQAVVLEEGVGTGGIGGDAGDFYLGVDPVTGASTWPAPARSAAPPTRTGRALAVVVGSNGGQGATRGGDGTAVKISYQGASAPPGEKGTSVSAEGGRGGAAIFGTGLMDLLWPSEMHGGEGGKAEAAGGGGGAGAGCGAYGGDGGGAYATGGEGGYALAARDELMFQGRAGDALARGGDGGAGGSCCDPPGWGGNGGKGGDAWATGGSGSSWNPPLRHGPGSDAYALGGSGGPGGDGSPPGGNYVGGGIAHAKGPGGDGNPCPGAAPPLRDETEPNDTAETATPMGTADFGRGSVDKVDGDPCDFFLKTLPAGSYEVRVTPVDGQLGLIAIWLGTQLLKVETDLSQPVPFPLAAPGDVSIQLGAPQADRNGYTFEILRF
ncbi:MAG: hypothetical protein HYU66_22485, partial [Armatimonadetes bacterium]|nr:hypothetical protein [Armatimonadota bacterium]